MNLSSVLQSRLLTGAETWHRIQDAIERLQAKAPAESEKAHYRQRTSAGEAMKTAAIVLGLIGAILFGVSWAGPKNPEPPPVKTPAFSLFTFWVGILCFLVAAAAETFNLDVPSEWSLHPLKLKMFLASMLEWGVAGLWYVIVRLFQGKLGVSLTQVLGSAFLIAAAICEVIDANSS